MSFYITLPSNVSLSLFKDNTITNYTTLLKKPLIFNVPYEVGLVEIIYNQSWRVNLGKIIINDNKILTEMNLYANDGETYDTLIKRINNILVNYTLKKEYQRRTGIMQELIKKIKIDVNNESVETINSLFIYTDIIDFQYIGDEMAPLLRNVVVANEYTHSVCRTYETPHYIPVNKSEIYSVNIDIRDNTGEKIHFIEGRVIIKLHFRQGYGF